MDKPWLAHYESPVPHTLTYPPVPVQQILADALARFPDNPALKMVLRYVGPQSIGCQLTYREFAAQVDRFAAALHSLGVRKGDRVAIMLPNLPQLPIAFFGVMKLGGIVANTNPMYTPREIEFQFADSGCETAVILSPYYAGVKQVQARTKVRNVIITDIPDYIPAPIDSAVRGQLAATGMLVDVAAGDGVYYWKALLAAHDEPPPAVDVSSQDIAVLQYTGGTTGISKGAMLTHGNLMANVLQLRAFIWKTENGCERTLGAIPMYHVYGMTNAMLASIQQGGNLIIIPNPRQTDLILETLNNEKVSFYPGVPAMYIGIINHPDVSKYDLKSIKACASGSAPLPMDVQIKFGEITGGSLVEGYGLSEASPTTHVTPIWGLRKPGSVGVPLPDTEARIVDYDTLQDKPRGEPGELWIRGPQVMAGYYNRPDETAKTITSDGWLRTGDIARMDEDGYFYIVDRLKDIIIVGGFNVVPREVEEVLFEHPAVQECVAIGVPDAHSGEAVKAFVVLRTGETVTAEELVAFCRQQLTGYKVPKQIEFRSELPKTMVGKVLRRVLVEEERRKALA